MIFEKYYSCKCNKLFKERKNFVRHRMSARKATRSELHRFLGIAWWTGK